MIQSQVYEKDSFKKKHDEGPQNQIISTIKTFSHESDAQYKASLY